MDIQTLGFLTDNSSLNIIYYLTNYMTKYGLRTYDSFLYATLAFKKFDKFNQNIIDDTSKAKKIISLMYNAAANHTEYSGAQVSSMIRNNGRDGTYYSSHKTVCINLYKLLATLDQQDESNDLILLPQQFINKINYYGLIYDYEHRPDLLNTLCLYEFSSSYAKTKVIKKRNENLDFKETHQQFATTQIKLTNEEFVPFILGPSIPRQNDIENKSLYAKCIMLLFKPWRNLTEFTKFQSSFETQLENYLIYCEEHKKLAILQYIANIDYLKKSLDDANEIKRDKRLRKQFLIENKAIFNFCKNIDDDEDDLLAYDQFEIDQLDQDNQDDNRIKKLNIWISKRVETINLYFNINKNINKESPNTLELDIINLIGSEFLLDVDSWKNQLVFFKKNGVPKTNTSQNWQRPQNINNSITNVTTMRQIGVKEIEMEYFLNPDQTLCYNLVTKKVFDPQSKQLILLFTGGGGMGKSETCKAIEHFFKINNVIEQLMLSSSTAFSANLMSEDSKYIFI
jgi:hypothetical protein